jgi:hypothetical protein
VVADVVGTEQAGKGFEEGAGRYHTNGDEDNPNCRATAIDGRHTGGLAGLGRTGCWRNVPDGREDRTTPIPECQSGDRSAEVGPGEVGGAVVGAIGRRRRRPQLGSNHISRA